MVICEHNKWEEFRQNSDQLQSNKDLFTTEMCLFQIHTHGSNWTSLHEQVPKEVLPTEYGGEAGSVQENWGMTGKILTSKAFYIQKSVL